MITQEQRDFYWEQGYLIIEDLFSEPEIDKIYNRLALHADKEWSNMLNPDRHDFIIMHTAQKLADMDKQSEKVQYWRECEETANLISKLFRDKRIVNILEELYNDQMYGLSTHMIWKKPGTSNAKQAWNPHQDNSYGQNVNGKILTINLMLDNTTVKNGAIYNFPGSHKEGLLDVNWDKSYEDPNKPGKYCNVPEQYKKYDVIGKKGTLYIQHGNLIHGSYGNTQTDTTRGMYSATYITKDEHFQPGNEAFRKKVEL